MQTEHAQYVTEAEAALDQLMVTNCNEKKAALSALREIETASNWLEANESNSTLHRFVTGKQIAIKNAQARYEKAVAEYRKRMEKAQEEEAKNEAEAKPVPTATAGFIARSHALIDMIANAPKLDTSPEHLMAVALPEFSQNYVQSKGVWYRRDEGGRLEAVVEDLVAEEVSRLMEEQQFGRVTGTAIELLREMEDSPVGVLPILNTWFGHMRSYKQIYKFLPSDETLEVCDYLLPVVISGTPFVLDRQTGNLTPEAPEGCNVLYPAVNVSAEGESRALDDMVSHHFRTQEEIDAFYQLCGISLFGYGIPNLVFLLGRGGSGKDMLFSLMRAVHGHRSVCQLNAVALMGHDESNDLVRLQSARLALCSFESSHHSDGAFKPAVLKSITSGGQNPLTARAKYAKAAVDIYYKGSLWLYGNRVPNLTGGGDFDGLDRRFVILPMTKKLPDIKPPTGFNSWADAMTACAPVFGFRCMDAFIKWQKAGAVGFTDVRRRIPERWRTLSNEHLMSGSRFGFLRDLFLPHSGEEGGLRESTVLDILSVVLKQENIRMGRSKYIDVLKDTMSPNCRFEHLRFMETDERGGERYLPLMIVPSTLKRLLDSMSQVEAQHILNKDPNWNEMVAASYAKVHTQITSRIELFGEDDGEGE